MVAEQVQILRFIDHEFALIQLRSDGIVKVTFKDNFVMDVESQEILFELYLEICDGKKYPFIFTALKDVVITKEARENSKKLETKAPSMATAIVATSLSYRLIANFYQKFNKPIIPFKLFRNEEEAVKWLHEQVKKPKNKKGT